MRGAPPKVAPGRGASRPVTPSPRPAAPAPSVKVLVAGVDKDARAAVEAVVRRAFAGRDAGESWSLSLVRLGRTWSVSLNGPGERFRNLSFSAEDHALAAAIAEVLRGDGARPAVGVGTPEAKAQPSVQERHACERCQQGILVSYEGPPEPKELAPVACPHCWAVSHLAIGAWAAAGGDYRADKA